jgi:hypothetical protein
MNEVVAGYTSGETGTTGMTGGHHTGMTGGHHTGAHTHASDRLL